jgi:hypothetical protein
MDTLFLARSSETTNRVIRYDAMFQGDQQSRPCSSACDILIFRSNKEELTRFPGEDGYQQLKQLFDQLQRSSILHRAAEKA